MGTLGTAALSLSALYAIQCLSGATWACVCVAGPWAWKGRELFWRGSALENPSCLADLWGGNTLMSNSGYISGCGHQNLLATLLQSLGVEQLT